MVSCDEVVDHALDVGVVFEQPSSRVGSHPGSVDPAFVKHEGQIGPQREQKLAGAANCC